MGNIGGSLAHNYRTIDTPNADPTRTAKNIHSLPNPESVKQAINERLPEKRRKDAVLCIEYLITASPEWEGWQNKVQQDEYFNRSIAWLEQRHGKENVITTSIHLDETTPHLVAYVVPIDHNGKLNCKHFLGGKNKLSTMQTEFARTVADLGLSRGIENSKARHTSIQKYYTDINQPIPKLPTITPPKKELLESGNKYGKRVVDEVLQALQPDFERIVALSLDNERLKYLLNDARQTSYELQNKTASYLEAIKQLQSSEILELDKIIKQTSKEFLEKRQKVEPIYKKTHNQQPMLETRIKPVAHRKNIPNSNLADRPKQTDITKNRDSWKHFYNGLPPNKRKIVDFNFQKASQQYTSQQAIDKLLDMMKTKLMQNPDLVNNLPKPPKDIER